MISRYLPLPDRSFFLLGPRGTGKSTWLRHGLKNAKWFNLLRNSEYLRLVQDPDLFRREIEPLPQGSWVVVDEVQRYPEILNEVQDVIAEKGENFIRFALTGSSARKLKRAGVNLLAGRAVAREFFPIVWPELAGKASILSLISYGAMPSCITAGSDADRKDYLESYVDTYIRQEIKEEALVRKLEPFARFLKVAATLNGQVVNLSGVSREVARPRTTVQTYYEILEDTLIGSFLPSWNSKAKVKEVAHPKFYFFDSGVARALRGTINEPMTDLDRGFGLETWFLGELRAYASYHRRKPMLAYWQTSSGSEIDLIWQEGKLKVGIEIKAGLKWKTEFGRSLSELLEDKKLSHAIGIYQGSSRQKYAGIDVMPVQDFLDSLWRGKSVLG